MKGTRVNRRLVLIAFIVAVLLGAGSQAVALWSQSSNVTMGVTYGKTAPVTVTGCQPKGNSGQVTISWANPAGVTMSNYTVTVYRFTASNQAVGSGVVHSVSGASFTIDGGANGVLAGERLSVTIVGQAGAYSSSTATYMGIYSSANAGGQVVINCPAA